MLQNHWERGRILRGCERDTTAWGSGGADFRLYDWSTLSSHQVGRSLLASDC